MKKDFLAAISETQKGAVKLIYGFEKRALVLCLKPVVWKISDSSKKMVDDWWSGPGSYQLNQGEKNILKEMNLSDPQIDLIRIRLMGVVPKPNLQQDPVGRLLSGPFKLDDPNVPVLMRDDKTGRTVLFINEAWRSDQKMHMCASLVRAGWMAENSFFKYISRCAFEQFVTKRDHLDIPLQRVMNQRSAGLYSRVYNRQPGVEI